MTCRRTTVAVLGMVAFGGALSAQSPSQRAEIERFRDDLGLEERATRLRDLEAAMIERGRADRDNPLLHVKLGFLALRLGELTESEQHYEDAASEFEWARDLAPAWPYAWWGIGLAELALGEHDLLLIESLREMFGKDALSKAADAFARAAALDPTFSQAVVDLGNTALERRRDSRLRVALEALRAATATPAGRDPAAWIARGRVERSLGEGDSALVAFAQAMRAGGDSALVTLELARTLFFVNRPLDAREWYYRAAAWADTGEALQLLRSDLSWIASDEQLAEFDSLGATGRPDWLRAFWERRDALDVRRPGERLAEHYRRYFHARRYYRLVSRRRRYDVINPYRTDQRQFDDRGLVYLRHGEPDRRAVHAALGVEPNESWLYREPGGDRIFHFAALDDVSDYKLVESVLDVLGLGTALRLQVDGLEGAASAVALLESRQALHSVYGRMLTGGLTHQINAMNDERRIGGSTIVWGTTTDTYGHRFASALDGNVQPFVVGDASGASRVLLAFAVAGHALQSQNVGTRIAYPLQLRVAVRDLGRGTFAAFLDTTRVFSAARALRRDEYLSGFVELPVEPGTYALEVLIAQPQAETGVVLSYDQLAVQQLTMDRFGVSDLVVGRERSGLAWLAESDSVWLNPLGTFPRGSVLSLYYEVYGLERGAVYRARVEVRPVRGGSGRPPVALSLEQVSSGALTRVVQSVDLTPLKPGQYWLTLTVEGATRDARHTRRAAIEVIRR